MPFKFKKFSAQKLTLIAFIYLPVSGTERFIMLFLALFFFAQTKKKSAFQVKEKLFILNNLPVW